VRKNTSGQKIGAQMVSATDGSAFTGSVTVHVTGDAGTQATGSVGSGACTHEGNGYHTYAPDQAETNYDLIAFTFVGTGAVPATVQVFTQDLAVVADAILDRNMATGSDSGSATVRTVRQALRMLRNKWAVSAGTLTVYKEDDSTTSWTGAVSSDPTADPITGNDPASS
jgi:hypothetical protein